MLFISRKRKPKYVQEKSKKIQGKFTESLIQKLEN